MNANKSILQCPECKKPLVNIGSKVERIHPIARFINNHNFTIVIILALVSTGLVFSGKFSGARSIGYAWVALLMAPSVIMYFLLRVFNLYRVTDCPYCGFHEEQKLGRSNIS